MADEISLHRRSIEEGIVNRRDVPVVVLADPDDHGHGVAVCRRWRSRKGQVGNCWQAGGGAQKNAWPFNEPTEKTKRDAPTEGVCLLSRSVKFPVENLMKMRKYFVMYYPERTRDRGASIY